MADTLYIIGNGFDLHHSLRTSYTNFHDDYLKKKRPQWLNFFQTIYGDAPKCEIWWNDFEKRLGEIDYSYGMDSHKGRVPFVLYLGDMLKHQIPSLFGDWIKDIDDRVEQDESLKFDEKSSFFTFNYTMVLEKTYHIDGNRIWHIHNSVADYQRKGTNPIVGHDVNSGELTIRLNQFMNANPSFRYDIADMMNRNIYDGGKKVLDRICQNEIRFDQYCDIIHFVAMGFSFNDIDMPYIKKIWSVNRHKDNADWTVYLHTPEDESITGRIIGLGVSEDNIHTKNW